MNVLRNAAEIKRTERLEKLKSLVKEINELGYGIKEESVVQTLKVEPKAIRNKKVLALLREAKKVAQEVVDEVDVPETPLAGNQITSNAAFDEDELEDEETAVEQAFSSAVMDAHFNGLEKDGMVADRQQIAVTVPERRETRPSTRPTPIFVEEYTMQELYDSPKDDLKTKLKYLYTRIRETFQPAKSDRDQTSTQAGAEKTKAVKEPSTTTKTPTIALSKRQKQLALEERQLWNKIIDSSSGQELEGVSVDSTDDASAGESESVDDAIDALALKSHAVAKSYTRLANGPTYLTFLQSKSLLRAMGIPVIVTQGAYEAEAVASSIVKNGYADYVASEDTVSCFPPSSASASSFLPLSHSGRVLIYGWL